jgi:hypothetical protein
MDADGRGWGEPLADLGCYANSRNYVDEWAPLGAELCFEANLEIDSAWPPHPSGCLAAVVSLRSAGEPGGAGEDALRVYFYDPQINADERRF